MGGGDSSPGEASRGAAPDQAVALRTVAEDQTLGIQAEERDHALGGEDDGGEWRRPAEMADSNA